MVAPAGPEYTQKAGDDVRNSAEAVTSGLRDEKVAYQGWRIALDCAASVPKCAPRASSTQ